jgi:zinc/manganese transport system substrate-binding protein
MLVYNGLDLEIGYLPVLIESSKNPKIQHGMPGNLDCSQYITPIEKSLSADRSMGDVHPLGNPHYHFSPKNILKAAEGISERLSSIDPAHADSYRANLISFRERLKEKQKQWNNKQLKGKKVVAYHKMFEYLAAEFGFEIIGYVEPKPGIPPSAGHIEKLIGIMQRAKPDAIMTTVYYGKKEPQFISQKTGVKIITVPHDVGATEKAKDWFTLIDHVLSTLE